MKTIFAILFLVLSLTSCTAFKDRDLKMAAMDVARANYQEAVIKEATDALGKDHIRLQDTIDYFAKHTEFLIEEIERDGDQKATVSVEMIALSTQVRRHMLGILGKIDGKGVNAFNFAEALRLIKQNDPKTPENEFHKIKINLVKTDKGWTGSN